MTKEQKTIIAIFTTAAVMIAAGLLMAVNELTTSSGTSAEASAGAVKPPGATKWQLDYARCMVTGLNVHPDIGYRDPDNMKIWMVQRCRHLEPHPKPIDTRAEMLTCLESYGRWFASELEINPYLKGHPGGRAATAAETVCAPVSMPKE